MNMDIPVTLVIKAPNQKYNDQTISCFSDWTVEKLKAHLSHVYPSKPSSKDQRLVYSGRLLSDDLQLKDVFRKQDEYHMIHLVCASRTPPPSPQPRKRSSRNKTQAAATDTHTRPASAGTTTTSTTTSPSPPAGAPCDVPVQPTAAHSPLNTTAHPAFTHGYPWPQVPMATAGPASGPLLPISPMSLFWWQQAYAWHLYTHYQASLAAYYQTVRPLQPDSQPEQPSEQQQQQQQQQQQRLAEAAGGEGPEEEDVHRDWLDWVYTGSRAVGLLSIIYFYSSFSRFLMVLIGMVMLYLHQAGWLPFNLVNELQDLADLGNQEELDADLNDLHDMERVMDDGVGDDDSDSSEEGSEGGGGGGGVIDEQNGFLSSAWGFITTFFTSLIPEAAGVPNAAN